MRVSIGDTTVQRAQAEEEIRETFERFHTSHSE
jgi:hypothetical protein